MEPITVRGRYFWQGQDRFLINGVVYQLHGSDGRQLGDPKDALCEENSDTVRRSIPLFKRLGINTLWIYSINPAKNHDAAMRMLAGAGIYVIVCLGSPPSTPAEPHGSFYPAPSLHRLFAAVDCMAAYSNTLGLAPAKLMLVHRQTPMSESAPWMRAAVRDVKRYMALASDVRNQRVLPLGFCTEKDGGRIMDEFHYFTGGAPEEAADFFAFDEYGWIGESSMAMSGYDQMVEQFAQARVPVFLSEYGARAGARARVFGEARALHGPAMTPVFSGGCVYEFFQAANRYGLVRGRADGTLRPTADFVSLRARLRTARAETPPVTLPGWADPRPPAPASATLAPVDAMPACPLDWERVRAQVEEGTPFLNS